MIIKENERLSNYTTVKIGGIAKQMLVPENKEELIELLTNREVQYFIGGGSNLLISEKEYEVVVNLREFNKKIEFLGNGRYKVGASVRLQSLISRINSDGYGGIEYLFSVPGLVGGAIVMNAGRGKKYKKSISDYLCYVEVIKAGKIYKISRDDCGFQYRNSIFKNSNMIIISAEFEFPVQEKKISEQLKEERIQYCREIQDNSHSNFGTVFCECNKYIMKMAKMLGMGEGKVRFSRKTTNWLLNTGNGTYAEASKAIRKVRKLHKLLGQKCELEIIMWE